MSLYRVCSTTMTAAMTYKLTRRAFDNFASLTSLQRKAGRARLFCCLLLTNQL